MPFVKLLTMRQTFTSVEDNILHYVYFNKKCSFQELEKQVLHSPLLKKPNINFSILKLEKDKLIYKNSGNIEITDEGKEAVENYNSYDDYTSYKMVK